MCFFRLYVDQKGEVVSSIEVKKCVVNIEKLKFEDVEIGGWLEGGLNSQDPFNTSIWGKHLWFKRLQDGVEEVGGENEVLGGEDEEEEDHFNTSIWRKHLGFKRLGDGECGDDDADKNSKRQKK